jgi:hypothetical protein
MSYMYDTSDMEQLRVRVQAMMESTLTTTLMTFLTSWALFSDDIRLAFTDSDADEGFMVINIIVFLLFVLEMVASSFCDPVYLALPSWQAQPGEQWYQTWIRRVSFGSFYFWLDLASTISLLMELPWVQGKPLS